MSNRHLLSNPIWQREELGEPIPDSPHAVSVALPRWQDVVGYEEQNPHVISRLQSGYPRFVIHPLVREVARTLGRCKPCLPLPSRKTACICLEFIRRWSNAPAELVEQADVVGVVTTEAGWSCLKAFWQHSGLIFSSRRAEAILEGNTSADNVQDVIPPLRSRLADLYDCAPDDVFLQPSGMAAAFAGLRAIMARNPGHPTVQIGFPYVDTLKLQEKFGHGVTLIHDLDHAAAELSSMLRHGTIAGCFGEIPGNPLLGSADLRMITPLLREHRVPLVADDVVATPYNIDLGNHAALIATSLTKYLAGSGDVMGGALICNPRSLFYRELKPLVQSNHEELLWSSDAAVLVARIDSFPERMRRHNDNGLLIAERLRHHPAIEQVWYPKWIHSAAYESVRRPAGGWGSLITFLPKNANIASPRIYDRLQCCKGPSLGTDFTLICPFTLLAHYTELDWAEACGVSRYLLRISVGLEDPEELWHRLDSALHG